MRNAYEITIRNCRNVSFVSNGTIRIAKNKLNVFYGKNGTGKTTLRQALRYIHSNDPADLKKLESFRYIQTRDQSLVPQATSNPSIKDLIIFDNRWIEDHCFNKSELQDNAFELYVRDGDTRGLEKAREKTIGELRGIIASEVDPLEKTLSDIQKKIGKRSARGGFTSKSPIVQAYQNGQPIGELGPTLAPIVQKMSAVQKAEWLKWHKNHPQPADEAMCPYCGYVDAARQDACRKYDLSRSTESVSRWELIASAFDQYGKTLSVHYTSVLGKIVKSTKSPASSDLAELEQLAGSIAEVLGALKEIKRALADGNNIDASSFVKSLSEQAEILSKCGIFRIRSGGLMTPESATLSRIVEAVDNLASAQNELETISKSLIFHIATNIEAHENEINAFLKQCGYPYCISIECNAQTSDAHVYLKPVGAPIVVEDAKSALSYGEQNALALVFLCMKQLSAETL